MNKPIIELVNVVKRYENHTAVDHVSFSIPKGTIFGLLGPNGAGKTSLIRIITTITKADEGQVLLNGEPLNQNHPAQIGYMPEERGLYKKMKVGEQLMYLAQLKGLSKKKAKAEIDGWLRKFEIEDWWNKKVEELSKGMQQKVQFITTVMHQPDLIILDEPFSGLDPINTNLIKKEIFNLHTKGVSIIFSTHRMEQIEEFCDEIVLINQGKIILNGKMKDIKNDFKEHMYEVNFEGTIDETLLSKYKIIEELPNKIIFQLNEGDHSNSLLNELMDSGIHILSFKEILPSLNEIFIKSVGDQHNE